MEHKKFNIDSYITLRQELHKIPEIGYKEFKTKELLYSIFKNMNGFSDNAKVIEIGDTGFYIDIWGLKECDKNVPKNLISIRCDLDALPLIDKTGMPYSSTFPGFSHSCGHDGHMAVVSGTMAYYLSNLSKVPNNFGVRFLYQPAEEGLNGAIVMLEAGCLDGVSVLFGFHNLPLFPVGTIGCVIGPIMGRHDYFEIKGKGGHGSSPEVFKNPIIVGSMIVKAISNIPAQEIPSEDRCVLSVCKFQSGHTFSVVPDEAYISGTVRSLKNQNGEKMISRVKEITEGISSIYGCSTDIKLQTAGIVLDNDKTETEAIKEIIKKHFILSTEKLPVMTSEDFSFFGERVPLCFVMLGTGDENHVDYIHSPNYDFNDKSLGIGVEYFISNRT